VATRQQILRFHVELNGISPSIWREVEVPATYSFWDLHVAIQDAMGWLDYHLHAFRVDTGGGKSVSIGIPDLELFDDTEELAGWEISVTDHFNEPGQTCQYEYDFGDGWDHTVQLVGIMMREKGRRYPRCIDGARACPPEDCGGIWGYHELLEVVADPTNEEHESMLEWLGGHYEPEFFDPKAVKFDNPKKRWRLAFEEP
jgi:hypothetical protein